MADLVFVAVVLVFFVVAVAHVRLCDRLIEPEEQDR